MWRSLVCSFALAGGNCAAIDCTALKPIPPSNTDTTASGNLDASIDLAFKKLAKAGGKLDGLYRSVTSNVLPTFPNADRLYMWERVLFLECQLISEAKSMTDREKLSAINDLYDKFAAKSPPQEMKHVQVDGDNNTVVQGSNNRVSK